MNGLLTFIIMEFSLAILRYDVSAIINGKEARQSNYKYVVSLRSNRHYYCAGAILDERHILTAAHCVHEYRHSNAFQIYAGVKRLHPFFPTTRRVIRIDIPKSFKPSRKDEMAERCPLSHPESDIAVLTLEKALELKNKIQKIQLPKSTDRLPYDEDCHFAGWGRTVKENPTPSSTLLYTILAIKQLEVCKNRLASHRDNEFCAIDPLEVASPAIGDSGSPIVCNDVVYGVLSVTCSHPKYPSIFTDVIKHVDFIEKATKN